MTALYDKLAEAGKSFAGSGFEQLCLEMIALKLREPESFHDHLCEPYWALPGGDLTGTGLENYHTLGCQFNSQKDWSKVARIIDEADISTDEDALGKLFEEFLSHGQNGVSKKRGEYYTPSPLCRLVCKIAIGGRDKVDTLYDPTCGSGGLLIEAVRELGIENIGHVYGQELNSNTADLSRLNFYLRNLPQDKVSIAAGDTLADPAFHLEGQCDCIVANPPYGAKWQGGKKSPFRDDPRFKDLPVMPPSNFADWVFIAHIASCLSQNGRACLLDMAGSLFRSSEKLIRFHFLKQGLIKAVVHLPGKLFANTQIPVELILLKKTPADRSVYFLDASQILEEGKELAKEQIDKIADMVLHRTEEKYVSKIRYFDGLNGFDPNNYTLVPSWYVDKKPEETSPYAHMSIEDLIETARSKRRENDRKMTEIEDELLRLVGDLGMD